jgi:hypothetical protein
MTLPLHPAHQPGLVVAVLIGFAFGFVLERAGFGRAPKLAAQFYGTDLTVFKVMFGAIVTAMLGATVLHVAGLLDFRALADGATSATFLWPMIAGGFLLGAGFILSGYCPGTSFVALASGKLDGLATVLGVVGGQLIWAELEWRPGFAAFHGSGDLGNLYLWELLRLPSRSGPVIVALAVTAMAVGCFAGAERLERLLAPRADASARATPAGRAGRLVLAGFAAVALVGLAGLALPAGTQAREREVAGIAQAELARRVLEEPWTVRVLDLRPAGACAERRIPGAECVPAEDLPRLGLGEAAPGRDLVLVPEDGLGAVPASAAAYPGRVLVLAGGWKGWQAYALAPPEPPGPEAAPAEAEAHRVRAGIHAALTGMKAAPPPPAPAAAPAGGGTRRGGGGGCSG